MYTYIINFISLFALTFHTVRLTILAYNAKRPVYFDSSGVLYSQRNVMSDSFSRPVNVNQHG